MIKNRVSIGLAHYPVYNKNREIVATSVTNLDIHDIARLASTYDLEAYFLIHPHDSQRQVVKELLAFWQEGYGAEYNPDRKEALSRLTLVDSIGQAESLLKEKYGEKLVTVATDARTYAHSISFSALRDRLAKDTETHILLLFGTGYGLTEEVMESADIILAPITGRGAYNHLSVRSAAAIILDRLLGQF